MGSRFLKYASTKHGNNPEQKKVPVGVLKRLLTAPLTAPSTALMPRHCYAGYSRHNHPNDLSVSAKMSYLCDRGRLLNPGRLPDH